MASRAGPNYLAQPAFALSDRAGHVALHWAEAHPVLTAEGILKGQARTLIAPERLSWDACLAWLHLPPRALQAVSVLLSIARGLLALLALVALVRALRTPAQRQLAVFFLLLIGLHLASTGAAGGGRLIAPVTPYIDLLAAFTLARLIGQPAEPLQLA